MTNELRSYERTSYEARLDVAYGARFHELNECFYQRLDVLFGFIGLVGGTTAFTAAVGQWQIAGAIAGACIAASAILERLIRPVERAAEHRRWRRQFSEMLSKIDGSVITMLEAIDAGLRVMQGEAPTGITALAPTAYNLTVCSAGRTDYLMPLSRFQRIVAILV